MHVALLNMSDFVLLLLVRLHLVYLVLFFRPYISRVVTSVVDHFLLGCQIHDIRTDTVHEILRVRCDYENVIVGRQVCFQPDDGAQV
jgi:hypothetical protein